MKTDKSYVSIEQNVCPVCTKKFDTGSILMDKRLKESMGKTTVTGVSLCPEHDALYKQGFIALVATEPPKAGESMKLGEEKRTGDVVHLRVSAFEQVFSGVSPYDDKGVMLPMMFIEQEVVTLLRGMMPEEG